MPNTESAARTRQAAFLISLFVRPLVEYLGAGNEAAIGLAAAFLLVWGNAAVGFIGSEDNAINGLFFAIPVVGLVGKVRGMEGPQVRALERGVSAA